MLAQKLILSYSSKILIQFIQIITSIFVARIVGPSVLGTIAFGLAFVYMFKFISDLGVGTAHIKLISEGRNEAACIGTFAAIKSLLTGTYVLLVLATLLIQKYIFKFRFETTAHQYVIIILLISIAMSELFYIPKATFIARTEQAKQDIPDIIMTLLHQILRIIVVLLGFRAIGLAFGNLLAIVLVIPIYIYLFRDYPIGKFDWELAKEYFKISLPITIILIAQTIVYWSDKVILQFFSNSEQVGYYAAGYSISGFIKLIGGSVGLLFFPIFSEAIANQRYNEINAKIYIFERFSFIYVLPFISFISLYSDLIVKLILGNSFLPSIPVLKIITFSAFISLISLPYGNVLSGIGLFKLLARLNVIQAIFFIIVCTFFVSPYFLNLKGLGTASAIILSEILLGLLFILSAKHNFRELKVLSNYKLLAFGIAYSCIAHFIYRILNDNLTLKVISIFIYFGIFWLSLYFLKLITKEDFNLIKKIFDFLAMKAYIKSEILSKTKR